LTIKAHKPTNSIFIRYYSNDLDRIVKLVKEQLDTEQPQVQIAAQMVITTQNALEQIGIQWGGAFLGQPTGNSGRGPAIVGSGFATGAAPVGGTGAVGGSGANPNFNPTGLLPISPTTGFPVGGNLVNLPLGNLATAANPALGLLFGIISRDFNINLAIQALEQQGKARTIAAPNVVTVQNAEALMSRGFEVPFVSQSGFGGTNVQFKDALLQLKVTPNVIDEDGVRKIRMKVLVENNEPNFAQTVLGNPPLFKRRNQTEVVVKEGERLVIGGVTLDSSATQIRQVPLLGRIPVLGWLFKSREINSTGEELIVVITPSVVTQSAKAAR
jgi:type IV pilus assembly protein PilQ